VPVIAVSPAAVPALGAELCLEREGERVRVGAHIRFRVRVGEDAESLNPAGAVDEQREDDRLPQHQHGVAAGDRIGIARRARDVFGLVIVAEPYLPQAGRLGAALGEFLEARDAQAGRPAIGAAGRVDEVVLRQIANRGAGPHVPDRRRHRARGRMSRDERRCKKRENRRVGKGAIRGFTA